MEALHSRLTSGEQSGGQEHCQPESPHRGPPKSPSQPHQQQQTGSQKPHGTQQQPKQSRRQHPERKRLRHQRQSFDSDTALEHKHEGTKATTVSSLSPGVPPSSAGGPTQSKPETQEGTPKQKRERKPQRPGKYVCTYCGRACAKPSVLQKHIRSHTGERPYPCAPCGFSFKTKSNLYKHRKSHTHRVKAGLVFGEQRSLEEQVTESEDETRQLSSASSHTERQGSEASIKSHETDRATDCTGGNNDSYAVKKRLALRLSRGKHGPRDSSDEKTSSLILGSKGSTESGYFSRSESTEQSQDSPPNTSAKSYAEIILGKYGRLGHLERMSRHHNQQPSGQEDKNISFTVPKKQVIDHITKLITINEAVVDTSKIDSVKPRRFSLSRKNSSESQKSSSMKEPLIHSPKAGDLGYKNSGSITMGVPCEKFHHPSLNVEQPAGQTSTAPLVRSHSMPSAASSFDASSGGPSKFRLSQSFDERQPSETQASRRYGMLRRQPAIEIPLGAELTKEEHEVSHSFYLDSVTTVPDHKQSQPQPYECEACGTGCKDWEGYKKHKQSLCLAHYPRNEVVISHMECSQLINHAVRAGASAVRKRRKEESFEFDDPSSPSLPSPDLLSGQCKDEKDAAYEGPRRLQTCSVIQHTSSFEKQESLCNENQSTEATKNSPPHEEYQLVPQKQPQQQSTIPTTRKLVRQHNVLVPEILVTEDSNMSTETSIEPTSTAKHSEKPDEFQWPQRSTSLAQLPIEKLPPKKKRLRLAEVAQSSGESSFDSISLPHSPSQDSSASYASSRSTSFEESNRPDMEIATSAPLRRSRAPHMLTVPGVHQHREMRRSASEQAPHDPQPTVLMAETRSKSFDYSCLSPERSAVGWRERRKCLLMRHTAIRDPDEEEEEQCTIPGRNPEHVSPSTSSQASPTSVYCSRSPTSPLSGDTVLHNPVKLQCKEIFSQWKLSQNIQLTGSTELSLTHCPSVDPVKEEVSHIHTGQPPPQAPQSYPTHGPSGAARARYLPMSTGLKLEIPLLHDDYSEVRVSHSHIQHSVPHITSSLELLRPVTSPAVAVRLQTDTLTLACAIYTTLSQSASSRPQEKVDAVSHNIGVPTAEYRNHRNINPDLQLWSDDGLRISGSGGNKRMLSPSNSIEIPPESQQQQKRVKEEEEREMGCVDKALVDTCNQEIKGENQSCLPSVCSPITHVGPSFPSLLSSTCNSWCYLNYIKPNPSTLDEQKPSVYSSWSTSGYDPNPPGLSSKTALSLLHCKQRLSPSIYTISPMSVRTTESMEQEDNKRPCSAEVYNSQSYCRDHEGTRNGEESADDDRSNRKEERKEEKKEEEEVQSCSRNKQPPEVWISERGSNEKYAIMDGGGGRKCQSEDCDFHLKNTSVLQKCSNRITESPPYNGKHCNVSFKVKGSLTEHVRSMSHGKETCCYPDGIDEGVCEEHSADPDKQRDHQYSDQGKSGHDEEDNAEDKDGRRDEDNRSKAAESSHTASSDSEKLHPGGQPMEPEPSQSVPLPHKDSTQKSSASARRALFARRRLDASASASSGGSRSPSTESLIPRREPSPPPPRPCQSPAPPSSLSPSSCHVTTSALRPVSPVTGLSGITVHSHGSESSGPPCSLADTSAQCQACIHPGDRPATARLSVDEVGLTHVTPHPMRPRGAHNLLSHLPLHSQQPSRAPSLLIPIGGIHMIQPRSLLPLYSLVSSPAAATANPAGTGTTWRLSDAPKGRFSLLQRQDTLRETSASSRASPPDPEASGGKSGSSQSDALLHRKSRGCFGVQHPSSPGTETRHLEVNTDAHVTERCVYPEATQGQKMAPSSQTQL
ncbi:transcription factor HIVEP3 [Siniperca chuatsi]|uniref:transcription factor HIVEP3 n=1 Tax=Siniperca chuatsi TaxID=119488 RepID=UPI001CE14521|nr:transcription factor HIVEP3 [Siniperca chuatsi]XP_044027873.1 transcription factor HIVEP3 [Siniperca chuatsi]XP_044027874.1 transcription factor HIVEP3 [Siniperca chuatsi]XP_044027875.1 transcription factor HIVEP3 [Siniperca chuatsi]